MTQHNLAEYNEIIQDLVAESIRCSPESWSEGLLKIDCDGKAINYSLKSEAQEEKAQISGELRQLCEELYVSMRNNDHIWVESVVHFFQQDNSWNFKINFNYGDSSSEPVQPNEAKVKPWWKFW